MRVHAVGTQWDGGTAGLLVRHDDGALDVLRPVGRVDWRVEPERTCVGTWGRGASKACPDAAPVGGGEQCLPCFRGRDPSSPAAQDVPECVFEPRCADGRPCTCSFGAVPHVVYVAFHGVLPKVGMTLERRVATRLLEQGADAYVVAARAPDRANARATEGRLAFLHRLPQWRTHRETLPQLSRPVPWDQVERRARALARKVGAVDGTVKRVVHAVEQPLPTTPHRVPAVGQHAGTWLGVKGPHLFYRPDAASVRLDVGRPPVAALPRGDLVARHIVIGA